MIVAGERATLNEYRFSVGLCALARGGNIWYNVSNLDEHFPQQRDVGSINHAAPDDAAPNAKQ